MSTFSPPRRVKDPIKLALAAVIIYAIAFWQGWEKPYWASVSAASVFLLSDGLTIHRGLVRTASAIAGGFIALAVIAMFPQQRWGYLAVSCVVLFLMGYGMTGLKEPYSFCVAAITYCVVLAVTQSIDYSDSGHAFEIVMLRITQTWMGSLVMIIVTVFVWPRRTIGEFEDLVRKGFTNQHRLYNVYRGMMSGEVKPRDTGETEYELITDVRGFVPTFTKEARQLRMEDAKFQVVSHIVLHGAEQDSFEMFEVGHHWHHFLHEVPAQMAALESLGESLYQVQGLELRKFLPDLEAMCAELERRFEHIERMLAREEPTHMPEPVTLSVDEAAIRSLTHIQTAALAVTKTQLEKLEGITRDLFNCMADIRMFERPADEHADHGSHDHGHGHGPVIDVDRLSGAAALVLAWVAAYFVWLYVWDIPMDTLYVAMTGIFAVIMTYRAEYPTLDWYWSWGLGTLVAGICYVLIMQHLDGYRELAALIFISTAGLYYLIYPHPHAANKMFVVISYFIVLSADNHQSYSMVHWLIYVLWLFLGITTAIVCRAIIIPPRPHFAFMRLLNRFFRHSDFLISAKAPDGTPKQGFPARWKAAVYHKDLLELPSKLSFCAGQINYKKFHGMTLEQVQEVVMNVFALGYRVKALVEAYEAPLPEVVEAQLADEKRDWHQVIEEWFRRPDISTPAPELAAELSERLARLEARIEEAFAQAEEGALSTRDYENFYRLLGSYRGLSQAMVDYVRIAGAFDWSQLRDMRFF
jgi:uncharacterized membrane protein YccC